MVARRPHSAERLGVVVNRIVGGVPRTRAAKEMYAAAHARAIETRDIEDMRAAVAAWDTYYVLIGGDAQWDREGFWQDERSKMRRGEC